MTSQPEQPQPRGSFTLEGRPAAGLYLLGWLLAGVGFGLLFIAVQVAPPVRGVLLMAALLIVAAGFASSAGYQIIARQARPAPAFRGPSPLLLLGIQLVLSVGFGLAWLALGAPDPTTSAVGFLVVSLTLLGTYFAVVWLFGVRSGALTWTEIGIPSPASPSRLAADVGAGIATGLVVWPLVTALTIFMALLLNSGPPDVVPRVQSVGDILLTALGAGILVPIGEELFFRGYALTAWLKDLGARSALIRSTIFFAFVHVLGLTATTFDEGVRQALLTVVVITPVGAALGWLFLRRGLVAAIAAHATFNLIAVLLLALAQLLPELPPPA